MELPRTAARAARLGILPSTGSTNADLAALAVGADPWPHRSLLVAEEQTAGRGRRGRTWTAPPGSSLAASLLLRLPLPPEALGWIPLAAGAAMAGSLRAEGVAASLKWPNDVLVGGRKVCGLLAEVLPGGAVVVGAGLNHRMTAEQLPVPTATSLAIEGGPTDPDLLVAGWLDALDPLLERLAAAGGDAVRSGLRDLLLERLETIGRHVRVALPDGTGIEGVATGFDPAGALVIDGHRAVAAGDVTHLRYE